jgi:hypothetical protein
MSIDAHQLKRLIEVELATLSDPRVEQHIRGLLIDPEPVLRDWDYGAVGQQCVCHDVLEHLPSNTAITYCEDGFGPRSPWGLVFLAGEHLSMGMDSQWFTTFLQACFQSQAITNLPIWRVFKTDAAGVRSAITREGEWQSTWDQVMKLRESDPDSQYGCDTSIPYERE